jgi:hypothetical protein
VFDFPGFQIYKYIRYSRPTKLFTMQVASMYSYMWCYDILFLFEFLIATIRRTIRKSGGGGYKPTETEQNPQTKSAHAGVAS